MNEEIIYNDLDDSYNDNLFDNSYDGLIYYYFFDNEQFIGDRFYLHCFTIMECWETHDIPTFSIVYEKYDRKYHMYLYFENGYKTGIVTSYFLSLNDKEIFSAKECNLNIKKFLNVNDSGKILPKSEKVFLSFLDRILNLKVFM